MRRAGMLLPLLAAVIILAAPAVFAGDAFESPAEPPRTKFAAMYWTPPGIPRRRPAFLTRCHRYCDGVSRLVVSTIHPNCMCVP